MKMESINLYRYKEKLDPWSSHSIIFTWIDQYQSSVRLLDVGTASGMLGKRFFNRGIHLTGIEINPDYAAIATPYYDEFYCLNIENVPPNVLLNQDIVVCADIFEHLPDPGKVLRNLVILQKPGTQFFVSVPNVANFWIRLNLLLGKFNYTENGILDRSHLRFFTSKTFRQLLKDSNLEITKLEVTPIPLTRVSSFFERKSFGILLHGLLAQITRLFPNFLGYQFVARAVVGSIGEEYGLPDR